MRPSEVENLKFKNIKDAHIEIVGAKHREEGKVSRLCRITDKVRETIQPFLGLNKSPEDFVFSTHSGGRLNKDFRSIAIKKACELVGIFPRDFYSTRRGTATEMFKAGYDVAKIAGQLGHRNISTTMLYIKPSLTETADCFKGF
jgi:integrase